MGAFDTLLLTCPHCGKTTHEHSKADDCYMQYYTLESAPLSIIGDIANKPLVCDHCAKNYVLQVEFKTHITALNQTEKD